MSGITFETAVRGQMLCRAALIAATGAGKTYGALRLAFALAESPEDVAVIDSENGRARLEADHFPGFRHYLLPKGQGNPKGYTDAQNAAYAAGAKVVVLDSVSPEWKHCLSLADRFGDWKTVRPPHEEWIEAMKFAPGHLIVTMRAKMKYSVSEVPRERGDGMRQVIEPTGMGPIQDENLPYEFDIVAYLDRNHLATFSNRCRPLDGKTMDMDEATPVIVKWLTEGTAIPTAEPLDVENLRSLLREDGHADAKIEAGFEVARRENSGQLHPDYVAEQTTKVEGRLDAKRKAKENVDTPEPVAATQ